MATSTTPSSSRSFAALRPGPRVSPHPHKIEGKNGIQEVFKKLLFMMDSEGISSQDLLTSSYINKYNTEETLMFSAKISVREQDLHRLCVMFDRVIRLHKEETAMINNPQLKEAYDNYQTLAKLLI